MTFREWLSFDFPKHEIIFDACGYNLLPFLGYPDTHSDPPVTHPIGIYLGGKNYVLNSPYNWAEINTSNNLCYSNFTHYHNNERNLRNICLANTSHLPFITKESVDPTKFEEYALSLLRHKFCLSPEGMGEDSHRHYEAIYFKCIPIINEPDNDFCLKRWGIPSRIKSKYENLPVLYTNDYSELTEEYLNNKYEEILNTVYDFNKLTLTYWKYNSFILCSQCQRIIKLESRYPEFNLLGA